MRDASFTVALTGQRWLSLSRRACWVHSACGPVEGVDEELAMIIEEGNSVRADMMPLEIVWRNPLCMVLAKLRLREASNLYYGWAEQAKKIRARRATWDANHK